VTNLVRVYEWFYAGQILLPGSEKKAVLNEVYNDFIQSLPPAKV
jgi:hypothetical protein